MKLNIETPNIEASQDLGGSLFSIGDHGMVFDILRSKMYSNPILAICREISSNARDAHREVKKENIPCEIILPNALEPFYKVRDFGPGISPDRIENIYIKYGASSKRDDNIQNGSFGMGAKTPFSYSDTFSIETINDGIKYNYTCFIDESRVGKIVQIGAATSTNLPSGTEISIPVKQADFQAFNSGTEFTTRYWDVPPIVKGGTISSKKLEFSLSGKEWAIGNSNSGYTKLQLIIDGIEYPIDATQLSSYSHYKLLKICHQNIFLYFGIGELSLSANRETIHFDKKTKEAIGLKLNKVYKDVFSEISKRIDACASLWEANVFVCSVLKIAFRDIAEFSNLKWKGQGLLSLKGNSTIKDGSALEIYKIAGYNKPASQRRYYVFFKDKTELYLDDLAISGSHLELFQKLFSDNCSSIQLLSKNDNTTWADFLKVNGLEDYNIKNISSVLSIPSPKKKAFRFLVFKYDISLSHLSLIPFSEMEKDKNKIYAFFKKDLYGDKRIIINGNSYHSSYFNFIFSVDKNISLYAVEENTPQDKIDEAFEGCTSLETFIKEKVLKNSKIDYTELRYMEQYQHLLRGYDLNLQNLIINNNSICKKYFSTFLKMKAAYIENQQIIGIASAFSNHNTFNIPNWIKSNPDKDIQTALKIINNKYPLLHFLSISGYNGKLSEAAAHYINLIDKEEEENKGVLNDKS